MPIFFMQAIEICDHRSKFKKEPRIFLLIRYKKPMKLTVHHEISHQTMNYPALSVRGIDGVNPRTG
ncbi:hypothetical protein A3F36_00690 [Candidatus Peribacteria bacterium RIFCSPHIGHO2_12_FULL_55_11]|nr:MAG: hypothetical protein A3F36_00690 [Candidatus Peribacteria bacterium RIFCSPHIGHO2_12_FULL_55_11]